MKLLTLLGLFAQTQLDISQIRGVCPSTVASVERQTCVGSGVNSNGTKWDCAGLVRIKLTMANGTVLGPYIVVSETQPSSTTVTWTNIPTP